MHTRRTTRRAQVLDAHAVVIGALLSALARLIHRPNTHTVRGGPDGEDAKGGWENGDDDGRE
jgi:hypothetical protein